MGKHDKIDVWQLMELERGRGQSFWTDSETWQANSDAREEHGIGENFNAEKIDKHCCMTNPRKRDLRIAPRCRPGFGNGRSDRSPAFSRPFAEQMTKPAPHA